MNIPLVLYIMGTWEERFISRKHVLGHFLERLPGQASLLVYTGVTKTTIVSPLTAPQSSLIEDRSLLPRVHPELAACWPLVDNETASHIITTAGELCDPLVSSLFDLGNAVDIENHESGNRVVPIAITVGGECCNVISFRKIEEGTAELKHGMKARIRIPMIGDAECTEWSAGGAPVRQICFARTVEEKPTWAAARFPHSTIVFRPLYRRKPVSVHIYQDGDRVVPSHTQSSRLDANPLIEISHSQTGGYAHADVTFNPWYQKQLAIVDERGNWSVWEMVGRHRRGKGNWKASCVKSGSLPWLDLGHAQNIDGSPRHDGWAVIEWVGDVNSFIVSDRRCPILYRTEGNETQPSAIELELKRKSEWILDVKRSACNVSQVFILTTSRIFWLDVSSVLAADSQNDASRPSLLPILSWRHFRDSEDTTLRLSSLVVSEELYLVLYSRLNHVVLAYRVPIAWDGYMHLTSISDPFVLEIPPVSEESAETQISPNAAQFSTLVLREIAHAPSAGSKEQYDAAAKIIKLFTIDSRLAVRESIYIGPARENGVSADDQQLGKDALRLRKRYPGVRRKQSTRSRDDFVVDDWDESVVSRGTFTVADTGISHITPLATPQWTTDYSSIYAIAFGKIIAGSSEVGEEQDRGFQDSIKELKDRMASADLTHLPNSKTMLEVLAGSPLLDDIDQNAHDYDGFLNEFLAPRMSRNPLTNSQLSIFPQQSLDLFGSSNVKLVDIYDRLVNDWLSTLQHDIPGRSRIMKERVIRKVAAELALTQLILRRKPLNEADIVRSREDTNRETIDDSSPVPVNPPLEIGKRRLSVPRLISSDYTLEPAASKTTIQSNFVAEEQEVSKSTNGTEPVYCGLASMATFYTQRPPSGAMTNLLSHWQVGSDPAAYSWERMAQTLEEEDLQRASKATTPKRRLRKKASQGTPLNSSQLPPVSSNALAAREWGSQPEVGEPSRMLRLQSSQAIEEDLPMTQVERGTFGGREGSRKTSMKARKKKRAAGF
ncbi:uncharacterized protein P174DRAFT_184093 [Aspergillus novofumigatus IBT 16806]|uniref:RNA polymerase I-specific transcription initiation factor RRN6-like protein n=1 Tax=Aspergillus novofumigatus (strain IBT 16806) TaxID=1392255 RepID=A0A2I1CA23_ASPN1|nr:uncharacterized protein P174DRAFT_184093 [Aspergillus novofumigatus IBT 16806]PKX94483.1 hypothetical protein P174DRAFT_184093 [Aspergillus novofumigatus IBT 16806]